MDYNVLLAEAIAVLKEASLHEKECDAKLKKAEEGNYRERLPSLRREYDVVFNKRIQGLQMLNYFRVMTRSEERRDYAAGLLEAGMAECKDLRDKQMNTLIPASSVLDVSAGSESHVVVGNDGKRRVVMIRRQDGQPDPILVMKEGYQRFGPPILGIGSDKVEILKAGRTLTQEATLEFGEYQLTIINTSESAPEVEADIECEDPFTHGKVRYRKTLGGGCAWCRSFGVATSKGELRIRLASTGVIRDTKIRLELSRITKLAKEELPGWGGGGGGGGSPAGSNSNSNAGAYGSGGGASSAPEAPLPNLYPTAPNGGGFDPIAEEMAAMQRSAQPPVDGYVIGGEPSVPRGASQSPSSASSHPVIPPPSNTPSASAAAAMPYGTQAVPMPEGYRGNDHHGGGGVPQPPPPYNARLAATNELPSKLGAPRERLRQIEKRTWSWYDEAPPGYGPAQFNANESADNRHILSAITNLTEPTPIE